MNHSLGPPSLLRRFLSRPGGLAQDTAWAGVSEGTQLVSSLGVFYLLTTQLGPSTYGLYAGLQAVAAAMATLSSASVVMFILQEAIRERRDIGRVLPLSLGMALMGGVLMTAVAAGFGPLLLPRISRELITIFTAAEVLAAAGVNVAAAAVQAVEGFAAAARLRTAFFVGRLLAVAALWGSGSLTLATLAGTLLVLNSVSGVAALFYCGRSLKAPLRLGLPRWTDVRRGLSYGGVLGGFAVQEDGDKVLMVRLGAPVDAGFYAAGYRAIQLVMLPIKSLLFASHNRFLVDEQGEKHQHLRRSMRFTAMAGAYAVVAAAAVLLLAPAVASILGPEYTKSAQVVRALTPLLVLRALSLFAFNGLIGLGRNGVRVAIVVSGAVTNIVANAVLIPRYSWYGAAVATIGAEAIFVALTWTALMYFQRHRDRSEGLGASPATVRLSDRT